MMFLSFSVRSVARPLAFQLLAVAMAIVIACGGESEDPADLVCSGLETVAERAGLITRGDAEVLATEMLAMPAPEVTGVEIERVWASCLTTRRSYEQGLLERQVLVNPELTSPDMPVWVVEVKGISRPAGISADNAAKTYNYAIVVMDTVSGESIAGARYQTPRMAPTLGE